MQHTMRSLLFTDRPFSFRTRFISTQSPPLKLTNFISTNISLHGKFFIFWRGRCVCIHICIYVYLCLYMNSNLIPNIPPVIPLASTIIRPMIECSFLHSTSFSPLHPCSSLVMSFFVLLWYYYLGQQKYLQFLAIAFEMWSLSQFYWLFKHFLIALELPLVVVWVSHPP